MIELSRWQCEHQGCRNSAFGVGSPIGLRAIGWKVEMHPSAPIASSLCCPLHFQVADFTAPEDRLDAARSYAVYQQTKLVTPEEGRPTRRIVKTGS